MDFGEPLETWIQDSARALAQAIVAAASIIDFSAAVIDGGFPQWVRSRLVQATVAEVDRLDLQGIIRPEIIEGKVGPQARAIGGASLPIFARYRPRPECAVQGNRSDRDTLTQIKARLANSGKRALLHFVGVN